MPCQLSKDRACQSAVGRLFRLLVVYLIMGFVWRRRPVSTRLSACCWRLVTKRTPDLAAAWLQHTTSQAQKMMSRQWSLRVAAAVSFDAASFVSVPEQLYNGPGGSEIWELGLSPAERSRQGSNHPIVHIAPRMGLGMFRWAFEIFYPEAPEGALKDSAGNHFLGRSQGRCCSLPLSCSCRRENHDCAASFASFLSSRFPFGLGIGRAFTPGSFGAPGHRRLPGPTGASKRQRSGACPASRAAGPGHGTCIVGPTPKGAGERGKGHS